VRRIRNSECGIVRVETARGRIVVFQYKKRLWWALFIDAIFCIELCGYPENLSLWRRNSCINTRALYAVVTNPIARKGVQRGEDPLGSPINTRKLYANVPNSIARKGQGRNSLAGSRGSAPWVTPATHPPATAASRQHPSATRIPARRGSGWRKFRRKCRARTKAAARACRISAQGTGRGRRIPPRVPVRAAMRR